MECLKNILWKNSSKDLPFIPLPNPQHNNEKSTNFDEKIICDKIYQKLFRIFLIFSMDFKKNSIQKNTFKENGKLIIFMEKVSANFLIKQMIELNCQINKENLINSYNKEHFKVFFN